MPKTKSDLDDLADRLFDRHYEDLFGYLYRLTGDRQRAADLAEQAIALGARDRRVALGDGRQRAWLYRIATDLALYGRFPRPLAARLPWVAGQSLSAAAGESVGPAAWGPGSRQAIGLEEAMAALPAGQRAPLLLFGRCGLDIREMALALGLSEGRARAGLAAARRQLREVYERTTAL
jgi:DNA-directed RNA polymerase specialized sigma24 family protein